MYMQQYSSGTGRAAIVTIYGQMRVPPTTMPARAMMQGLRLSVLLARSNCCRTRLSVMPPQSASVLVQIFSSLSPFWKVWFSGVHTWNLSYMHRRLSVKTRFLARLDFPPLFQTFCCAWNLFVTRFRSKFRRAAYFHLICGFLSRLHPCCGHRIRWSSRSRQQEHLSYPHPHLGRR